MNTTMTTLLALAITACASLAEPAFFTDKPYAEAKQAAADDDKLFFVKATADWCGPCKLMDRTTFVDQRVIDWLSERAVSVSVDVDDEPQLAGRLKIRAMPTTILMRGDEELARVVGYRDADDLLEWLAEASGGRIVPVAERPRPPADDIRGRMDRARELTQADDFAAATDEYLWLWNNMVKQEPAMSGVRVSFLARSMADLAVRSPEAKAVFVKLRDETEDRLINGKTDGDTRKKSWDDLRDWLVLNERVLKDREPVLAWVDRIKDRPTATQTFARTRDIIDDVLIDNGRWALYGRLIDDPYRDIEMHLIIQEMDAKRDKGLDKAMRKEITSRRQRAFAQTIGKTVAGLLAAGREDEAKRVADRAIEIQDDLPMRTGIVSYSLDAEQARGWHLDLLDGVDDERMKTKLAPMRQKIEAKLRG